jgi:hypothetical protein
MAASRFAGGETASPTLVLSPKQTSDVAHHGPNGPDLGHAFAREQDQVFNLMILDMLLRRWTEASAASIQSADSIVFN